ncbi:uncharacterized protein G2W53_025191 [Senna tora]|uniref:Uncharacterized protein n=1 Tax=Senna tora TaxID=362788 RepID=A0A834TEN7_9FABA|nr:uncharacterized protein G2W53_025191 [Senna tora]
MSPVKTANGNGTRDTFLKSKAHDAHHEGTNLRKREG